MKKTSLIIFLTIFTAFLLYYAGTKPFAVESAAGSSVIDDDQGVLPDHSLSGTSGQLAPASNLSCADPIPSNVVNCQKIEQEILDSTVRLLMYTPIMYVEGSGVQIVNSNGHATVKEGRYLVSHNHYSEEVMALLQQGDPENLLTINVIDADGDIILRVPAQTVSVPVADRESIVLDFGVKDGLGVFEALGLPSAQFRESSFSTVQPGMEVAQIDWDGWSSHLVWTTIEAVTTVSDTPIVKLSSCIRSGASGGGLFWQGVHIGNNWSRSPDCGQELDSANYSFVALNTQLVVTP